MGQYWRILVMALLAAISLSSCQPKQIATPTVENLPLSTQNETIAQPTQEGEPYVPPAQNQPNNPSALDELPYPSPAQGSSVYNPYPGPSENVNNYLDWAAAEGLIMGGKVSKIYYDASLHVTLVLKDGNVGLTIEPAQDEVSKVIEQCGEPCADIEQIKE